MIFDPRKGGVIFSTFLTPPPTSLKTSKNGFQGGGGGSREVRIKNSLGDAFIGQNNDLQEGKQTIQPLEVGHANTRQKAQNGGAYGVFP